MNNLEQPIATGRTAEIYLWEGDKVLKLFFPSIPNSWIDKEESTGRYIQNMQLLVPKVYERVKLKGRKGIVYEKIDGPSLLNELAKKPWTIVQSARLLARLHVQVHQITAPPNIETQRDWAGNGIRDSKKLPPKLREEVMQLLDTLPVGNQLCHGDFHPGNIILTKRGPIIIDWMTASGGTEVGDMARTSIILEAARSPEGTPMRWLLERIRVLFLNTYLKNYSQIHPVDKKLYHAWRSVMAANFMEVCLPEEEPTFLMIIEKGLRSWKGS